LVKKKKNKKIIPKAKAKKKKLYLGGSELGTPNWKVDATSTKTRRAQRWMQDHQYTFRFAFTWSIQRKLLSTCQWQVDRSTL